eukprot:1086685-Prymnesium_polylepis.1
MRRERRGFLRSTISLDDPFGSGSSSSSGATARRRASREAERALHARRTPHVHTRQRDHTRGGPSRSGRGGQPHGALGVIKEATTARSGRPAARTRRAARARARWRAAERTRASPARRRAGRGRQSAGPPREQMRQEEGRPVRGFGSARSRERTVCLARCGLRRQEAWAHAGEGIAAAAAAAAAAGCGFQA